VCRENQNLDLLDPEFHIRWRERLSHATWVVIAPDDSAERARKTRAQ
jgi:hypothetical protein